MRHLQWSSIISKNSQWFLPLDQRHHLQVQALNSCKISKNLKVLLFNFSKLTLVNYLFLPFIFILNSMVATALLSLLFSDKGSEPAEARDWLLYNILASIYLLILYTMIFQFLVPSTIKLYPEFQLIYSNQITKKWSLRKSNK